MREAEWKPEHVALLGKMPDKRVQEITEKTRSQVVGKRRRMNIPAYEAQKQKRWAKWEIALLGSMNDREVAEVTGRDSISVRTARFYYGVVGWKITAAEKSQEMLGRWAAAALNKTEN